MFLLKHGIIWNKLQKCLEYHIKISVDAVELEKEQLVVLYGNIRVKTNYNTKLMEGNNGWGLPKSIGEVLVGKYIPI